VHGHIEGDACIRAVSQCILANADERASVFRFGGEEILVLSAGQSTLQALSRAERIRAAIEALGIPHRGIDDGCVTVSLGVALTFPPVVALERLLQDADAALYEAKRLGRNTVALADGLVPSSGEDSAAA
jgi:diguanylate cyclase (GGDEF)-like protein